MRLLPGSGTWTSPRLVEENRGLAESKLHAESNEPQILAILRQADGSTSLAACYHAQAMR